jgi:hypothetical protein
MRTRIILPAATALFLVACGDLPMLSGPPAREPDRLQIELAAGEFLTGDTLPLRWTVLDAWGHPIEPLPSWAVPQLHDTENLLQMSQGRIAIVASGQTTLHLSLAGLTATATMRINPSSLFVGVPAAYLTQVVQRLDGSVPLVANRDAILRVFVQGNAANFFRPTIRARFSRGGVVVATMEAAAADEGVPVRIEEGVLGRSWNIPVPGSVLQPGTSMLVEVQRDGGLRAAQASALTFPASGQPQLLDIRAVPPFEITFVPIHTIGFATGDVTPQNVDSYMEATLAVWPLEQVDVAVRAPYSTTTRSATDADWSALLLEIRNLRLMEGSRRYYHGILRREGAWSGLAYVGYPAGITRDGNSTWTVAHELGHNFGRRHAPCGNPSGVDAAFPHPNGGIGVWALAMDGTTLHSPARVDLMTYCSPRWVSDYNYVAAISFRATEAATGGPRRNVVDDAASADARRAGDAPVVIVSGVIGRDGIRMEPAFTMRTTPVLPRGDGPHTLTGLDDRGGVLFRVSFDGEEISEGPEDVRHFAFAIPLPDIAEARLARIRLDAAGRSAVLASALPERDVVALGSRRAARDRAILDAGVSVTAGAAAAGGIPRGAGAALVRWDATRFPVAVVRDPASGLVIARLTGGSGEIRTDARELDVHLSDGVASSMRRITVTR